MKSKLMKMLAVHEGLRLEPYHCTAGKLTIGIGHNLEARPISIRAAWLILGDDLMETGRELRQAMGGRFDMLDPVRQDVLLDMAFNLGVPGLMTFKRMFAALDRSDFNLAAYEMLESDWARQVDDGEGGRIGRADELAEMMRTREYPELLLAKMHAVKVRHPDMQSE